MLKKAGTGACLLLSFLTAQLNASVPCSAQAGVMLKKIEEKAKPTPPPVVVVEQEDPLPSPEKAWWEVILDWFK